jgi:hypothetical protein
VRANYRPSCASRHVGEGIGILPPEWNVTGLITGPATVTALISWLYHQYLWHDVEAGTCEEAGPLHHKR